MPDLGLEVLWKGKNFVRLLGGLWVALRISLIAAGISVVLGILLGVAASRKRSVPSVILRVWLGIIHIMPQMVLLFLMYFGTTRAFGWNLSGEVAAVIVFSLWGTAEMGDLVRGAVGSIPAIQRESAEALGLKPAQVYRWIILPQAVRRLIPQSINLITRMIKTTSLVTLIGVLEIAEGRHPVVEQAMNDGEFVPNDTHLNCEGSRMCIITGPNMAGKSTYMRQVALITLMAHIGSFVPAASANIPIVDRIFTRVGASDDLASGQSTFMVEMSETAYILRNATEKSLVILDEIGRGTSTFDGLAIAWAVVEYLTDKEKSGAKTLFATHYHELSELEGHIEGVENYCISVREHGEDVIFLRKIVRGGADKSFGVHVARLAGVPKPVLVRAHEIQARLEVSNINQKGIGQNILEDNADRPAEQVDIFDFERTEIINELQSIDVMALTPMDAINKLFLLREKARKL